MISAIIVNRNGEVHLERCLGSLEGSGAEVLLVDNASEDESLTLIARRFPEVRVFRQNKNLGFAVANNLAAADARGEALLLMNVDAWLEPKALGRLESALEGDPGLGLVAPQLRYPDGRRQFSWSPARGVVGEVLQKALNPFEAQSWTHGRIVKALAGTVGRPWYSAACVLVRSEAYRAVGGFDEGYFMYYEDVDLCRRLEAAGWRLGQESRAIAGHVGGTSGRGEIDDFYRPSQLRYYRMCRPRWERRFVEWRLRRRYGKTTFERWLKMERK